MFTRGAALRGIPRSGLYDGSRFVRSPRIPRFARSPWEAGSPWEGGGVYGGYEGGYEEPDEVDPLPPRTVAVSRDPDGEERDVSYDDMDLNTGTVRHDAPAARAPMPMSRRDAEGIRQTALRDADAFLGKRKDSPYAAGVFDPLLSTVATGVGAGAAGYLAGRFRGTSGAVTIPLVAAALSHGAAYLKLGGPQVDRHLHSVGDGVISGLIALWAAGHGALKAEGQGAVTGHVPHAPHVQPQQLAPQPFVQHAPQPFMQHVPPAHQPFRRGG